MCLSDQCKRKRWREEVSLDDTLLNCLHKNTCINVVLYIFIALSKLPVVVDTTYSMEKLYGSKIKKRHLFGLVYGV